MPENIGIWTIGNEGRPTRLSRGSIELESYLEDWIEGDPSLLEHGLEIVARQMHVDTGFLDLLALDTQNRWCVIEIKRDTIHRKAVVQALDYVSCIRHMPTDELTQKVNQYLKQHKTTLQQLLKRRGISIDTLHTLEDRDFVIYVCGLRSDPNLERIAQGIVYEVKTVTFQVFEDPNSQRVIIRDLSELNMEVISESPVRNIRPADSPNRSWKSLAVEEVVAQAEANGIGHEFKSILDTAVGHGIYPRPHKKCIMYTPPQNKSRYLFTVYSEPIDDRLGMWLNPSAVAEFYPVSEREAIRHLGPYDWYELSSKDVAALVTGLDNLFKIIEKKNNQD